MNTILVLEWIGSICGIAGAVLMARKNRTSALAYPLWIVSSVALVLFAMKTKHSGLFLQQLVFTIINSVGLYHWIVKPALANQGHPPHYWWRRGRLVVRRMG